MSDGSGFTRSGYTLLGWAESSSATSADYNLSASYTTNASKTLYAVWQANGCGGTLTITTAKVPHPATGYLIPTINIKCSRCGQVFATSGANAEGTFNAVKTNCNGKTHTYLYEWALENYGEAFANQIKPK